jgi:dihydroxy-acid dehydratase
VKEKKIELLVDDAEIARRMQDHIRPEAPKRGYRALYAERVLQAPEGCDFDFLLHEDLHPAKTQ